MKSKITNKQQKEVEVLVKELRECGDEHCGHILTMEQMKEGLPEWIETIKKKCGQLNLSALSKEESREKLDKYTKCFRKEKAKSSLQKKITKRADCIESNCKHVNEKFEKLEEKMFQRANKKRESRKSIKNRRSSSSSISTAKKSLQKKSAKKSI
jgi:hypothetical protein